MTQQNIDGLVDLLTIMTNKIRVLEDWKKGIDERVAAEDEARQQSQKEFDEFIERRKAEEEKRATDAAALREMMV